jgi:transposase
MEPIIERASGVDVGQATVVATILVGEAHQRPRKETRSFRTVTRELLAMRDWFVTEGVTHVGMESTGVYWKPVYAVLEDAFEVIVGNAHHIKNVPGSRGSGVGRAVPARDAMSCTAAGSSRDTTTSERGARSGTR